MKKISSLCKKGLGFRVCLFQIHLGHFLDAMSGQQKNPQVFDFDMKTTNTLHWKKSNIYKQRKHDSKNNGDFHL
jgi:hypothetical protein